MLRQPMAAPPLLLAYRPLEEARAASVAAVRDLVNLARPAVAAVTAPSAEQEFSVRERTAEARFRGALAAAVAPGVWDQGARNLKEVAGRGS